MAAAQPSNIQIRTAPLHHSLPPAQILLPMTTHASTLSLPRACREAAATESTKRVADRRAIVASNPIGGSAS